MRKPSVKVPKGKRMRSKVYKPSWKQLGKGRFAPKPKVRVKSDN